MACSKTLCRDGLLLTHLATRVIRFEGSNVIEKLEVERFNQLIEGLGPKIRPDLIHDQVNGRRGMLSVLRDSRIDALFRSFEIHIITRQPRERSKASISGTRSRPPLDRPDVAASIPA
jgi:hypothetical protein